MPTSDRIQHLIHSTRTGEGQEPSRHGQNQQTGRVKTHRDGHHDDRIVWRDWSLLALVEFQLSTVLSLG